jgi:centromeric protein E
VHVRVRPLNDLERDKGKAWRVEANSVFQVDPGTDQKLSDNVYKLDTVFDGSQSTGEVYEKTTQHLIQQVVEGFNSTVFAYGQTSSGKTHTMRGMAGEPGIIPLAVSEIFSLIGQTQEREFLIRVSYMEVRCWGGWVGGGWLGQLRVRVGLASCWGLAIIMVPCYLTNIA